MRFFRNNWTYLVLFLFCLTPVIWFIGKGNVLINGLDTNFPLDPLIWFGRRFYVWNNIINLGSDFSSSTSGLFFHLLQVVPYKMGFNLQVTQIFTLIFWFSTIVFSSYFFISSIIDNKITRNKIARSIFVVIYTFNIYLFNTWENVKVSNLALVVSLPLILGLFIRFQNGLLSKKQLFAYTSLASLISVGAGINPAYSFTIILGIFVYVMTAIFIAKSGKEVSNTISGFILILASFLLANLFWILPLANFMFISKKIGSLGDIGFTNRLNSLSENTSLLNILRLQGAWDWYAIEPKTGLPYYIPYATKYFNNVFFIFYSFLLPTISFISLIFISKNKKNYGIYFATLLILGTFLGAGTHSPSGIVYSLLVNKAPLFSFFRSPWYIFTPLLIIAYGGLWALLYVRLAPKLGSRILISIFAIFTLTYLIYNYPLVTGKIFRPGADGFYVTFPSYVFEVRDWLAKEPSKNRILTYPDDQLESFKWGYKGTESILELFSNHELITPSFNLQDKVYQEIVNKLYLNLKAGQYSSALLMFPLFGIDTIFTKNDINGSLATPIDESDPSLTSLTNVTKFGPWTFLKLKDVFLIDKIYIPQSIFLNTSKPEVLAQVASLLPRHSLIFNNLQDQIINETKIDKEAGIITEAINNTITGKPLLNIHEYVVSPINEGSYSLVIEKKGLTDSRELQIYLDGVALPNERIVTTDSLFVIKKIFLTKGDHKITINYPVNKNIIDPGKIENYINLGALRGDEIPQDKNIIVAYNGDTFEKTIVVPTKGYDPFLTYELTFDYKYIYGNSLTLDVIQSATSAPVKSYIEKVGNSFDWEHKNVLVTSVPTTSKLGVIFYLPANNIGDKSKSFIENVSLSRVYDNRVFILGDQANTVVPTTIVTKYTMINPAEYTVEVGGPPNSFYLVFLESYSNDWVLKNQNGKYINSHFKAQGYANGWYVSKNDFTQNFTIMYRPQRYFDFGFKVVIGTIFVSIFLLLYSRFKKKV